MSSLRTIQYIYQAWSASTETHTQTQITKLDVTETIVQQLQIKLKSLSGFRYGNER